MPDSFLPLFPLSLVLLPTAIVPLHIFEDRYQKLMAKVIPEQGEFGIVLAKDGGIVNVGCTAVVERVLQRYEDGRMDLIARGQRRFQIKTVDEGETYLRADVEFFGDLRDQPAPEPLRLRAIGDYEKLRRPESGQESAPMSPDSPNLSFELGALLDDLEHQQALLVLRSEADRLAYLIKSLPGYLASKEQKTTAKRVAPLNGHAKHFQEKQ